VCASVHAACRRSLSSLCAGTMRSSAPWRSRPCLLADPETLFSARGACCLSLRGSCFRRGELFVPRSVLRPRVRKVDARTEGGARGYSIPFPNTRTGQNLAGEAQTAPPAGLLAGRPARLRTRRSSCVFEKMSVAISNSSEFESGSNSSHEYPSLPSFACSRHRSKPSCSAGEAGQAGRRRRPLSPARQEDGKTRN